MSAHLPLGQLLIGAFGVWGVVGLAACLYGGLALLVRRLVRRLGRSERRRVERPETDA